MADRFLALSKMEGQTRQYFDSVALFSFDDIITCSAFLKEKRTKIFFVAARKEDDYRFLNPKIYEVNFEISVLKSQILLKH